MYGRSVGALFWLFKEERIRKDAIEKEAKHSEKMADAPDIDLYADDLGDDFQGVSFTFANCWNFLSSWRRLRRRKEFGWIVEWNRRKMGWRLTSDALSMAFSLVDRHSNVFREWLAKIALWLPYWTGGRGWRTSRWRPGLVRWSSHDGHQLLRRKGKQWEGKAYHHSLFTLFTSAAVRKCTAPSFIIIFNWSASLINTAVSSAVQL